MELPIKYRGIQATSEHVNTINEVINAFPHESRRAISRRLCRTWNWIQPNGALRDMVCRGFLLALHRNGYIKLPDPLYRGSGRRAVSGITTSIDINTNPISGSLSDISPIHISETRQAGTRDIYKGLIGKYHYLGFSQPVGENICYIAYCDNRPIACCAFSSAPRHIGCRDRYIGWDARKRRTGLKGVVYNTRFLIMPWVQVPHLASHLLARFVRRLRTDWKEVYGHSIYFIETFVDTERFAGTCYKAANWRYLGLTTGLGKDARSKKVNRSIKAVWCYPLCKDFREKLCA